MVSKSATMCRTKSSQSLDVRQTICGQRNQNPFDVPRYCTGGTDSDDGVGWCSMSSSERSELCGLPIPTLSDERRRFCEIMLPNSGGDNPSASEYYIPCQSDSIHPAGTLIGQAMVCIGKNCDPFCALPQNQPPPPTT
jgi:hypothetical protein